MIIIIKVFSECKYRINISYWYELLWFFNSDDELFFPGDRKKEIN